MLPSGTIFFEICQMATSDSTYRKTKTFIAVTVLIVVMVVLDVSIRHW